MSRVSDWESERSLHGNLSLSSKDQAEFDFCTCK